MSDASVGKDDVVADDDNDDDGDDDYDDADDEDDGDGNDDYALDTYTCLAGVLPPGE